MQRHSQKAGICKPGRTQVTKPLRGKFVLLRETLYNICKRSLIRQKHGCLWSWAPTFKLVFWLWAPTFRLVFESNINCPFSWALHLQPSRIDNTVAWILFYKPSLPPSRNTSPTRIQRDMMGFWHAYNPVRPWSPSNCVSVTSRSSLLAFHMHVTKQLSPFSLSL